LLVQTSFYEVLHEVFRIIGLYPSGTSVNRILPALSVVLGVDPAHGLPTEWRFASCRTGSVRSALSKATTLSHIVDKKTYCSLLESASGMTRTSGWSFCTVLKKL
jgi:hypothetical protein